MADAPCVLGNLPTQSKQDETRPRILRRCTTHRAFRRAATSKAQSVVSHSAPEADIAPADFGLRNGLHQPHFLNSLLVWKK